MTNYSEIKPFICSCFAEIMTVQRAGNELCLDYYISYRPTEDQKVEDFYVRIPLSKRDRISTMMKIIYDCGRDECMSLNVDFENEYGCDEDTITTQRYRLVIDKEYTIYSFKVYLLDQMDEDDADAGFVWEWCSYGPTWLELMEFITQLEDQLEDELYS